MSDFLIPKHYAEHRGVSRSYISRLVKEGRIELIDGKIDVQKADLDLGPVKAKLRQAKNESVPNQDQNDADDSVTLVKARTRHELAKARTVEFSLREKQGLFVLKESVRNIFSETMISFAAELDGIPNRLARRLAEMTDAAEIRDLLLTEIRKARETASHNMMEKVK